MWRKLHERYWASYESRLAELQQRVVGEDDRGFFMEVLRRFKTEVEAAIYQEYKSQQFDFEELSLRLTALAQACLQSAYLFERVDLVERYGLPQCHFHMVAMGKFGGCEMSLHSDLDLIFIFEKPKKTSGPEMITNQEYFVKLIQRMMTNLSAMTQCGRAYEIDAELRPSGRSGILVTSWDSFIDYHQRTARVWEKQALLKSRPIEPDLSVGEEVHHQLMLQVWNHGFDDNLGQEIDTLRMRMQVELAQEVGSYYHIKVGQGGLVDIEFAVQYLQLKHGLQYKEILTPNTLSTLRSLARLGLCESALVEEMEQAYLFYRQIETRLRERNNSSKGRFDSADGELWDDLAAALLYDSGPAIKQDYETYRQNIRQSYRLILGLK